MGGEFTGAILAVFGTAIGGYLLDRWLGIRAKVTGWWVTKRQRREARRNLWDAIPGWLEDAKALRAGVEGLNQRDGQLTAQFKALGADVQRIAAIASETLSMTEMEFEWSPVPKFICDPTGRNLKVNRAYFRALGVAREDLLDFGYRTLIAREELLPYMTDVMSAISDHRNHTSEVTFVVNGVRKRFEVTLIMHPPSISVGPLERIVGTLESVE